MANVSFKVPMDNRVQPGTQTKDEILAELRNQGHAPNAANQVRDPITDKLLYVEINLPETAAAAAKAAIDANPGKSGPPVVAVPTPLRLNNLIDIQDYSSDLLMANTDANWGAEDQISVAIVAETAIGRTYLGARGVTKSGVTAYQDEQTELAVDYTVIDLTWIKFSGGAPPTFPAYGQHLSSLAFEDASGVHVLPFSTSGGISLAGLDTLAGGGGAGFDVGNFVQLYVGSDYKAYFKQATRSDGSVQIPNRTFEEAVAAGAL